MFSKKKIVRDLIIIVVIIVVVVLGLNYYKTNKASQKTDTANAEFNPHTGMDPNAPQAEGDGTQFEDKSDRVVMKIDEEEITIGQIDTQARKQFGMISRGMVGLTKDIRDELRKEAMRQLILNKALKKGAEEMGVQVTQKDIDEDFARMAAEQGGEKQFKDFLLANKVSEESLRNLREKEILQTRLFEAVVAKHAPEGSDSEKEEAYNDYLQGIAASIPVDITDKELMQVYMSPDKQQNTAAPHGDMGESASPHGEMPPPAAEGGDSAKETPESPDKGT